ncbi:hypothetical protein HYR99_30005 [Candidatus Poribacteria bacterium]|nr:hypothetical protein [Candidatus Poribacteria bacterium]
MKTNSNSVAAPVKVAAAPTSRSYWLYNRQWDLTFIILSSSLIALPLVLNLGLNEVFGYWILDAERARNMSRLVVALSVTLAIGGPHLYSTFTRTFMEKSFIKKHPYLITIGTLLVPTGVISLGMMNLTLLLTCFFFWASVHVLHQIAYLVVCYNTKSPAPLSWKSRLIDYAVVLTSMYPTAFYRMVKGTFAIGSRHLMFPEFLSVDWFWQLATVLFAFLLILFTAKTIREIKAGVVLWPKVLLIYISAFAAFLVPMFPDLDVAFQGLNTWHSFQYLGLTWYINRLRHKRGEISLDFVRKLSNNTLAYYGLMMGMTLGAGLIIFLLWKGIGLEYEQCYYITVLSFLLMHYLQDHVLFTDIGVLKRGIA